MLELGSRRSVIRELFEYAKMRKSKIGESRVFDFSLGNPSVEPPRELSESLVKLITEEPQIALHGYTSAQGDAAVRAAIASYLNERHGEEFSENDIYMTVGAAAALTATLTALVNEGEEVIVPAPYFPEYKVFVEKCGGVLVPVLSDNPNFYPEAERIRERITERTAAIIINSPNNPTGAVYPESVIREITNMLKEEEKRVGHPIYLISDEPYRELVGEGVFGPYLTKYYDDTVVCYSYSKSLSIPGERIGYALVSPRAASADEVYRAICGAGRALGFVCAPSLLQRLIPTVIGKTADLATYSENRELLKRSLAEYGYEFVNPEGAFYLFLRAPEPDAYAFCEVAKKHELILVPSDDFGCPGYVRIAYCVKTEAIAASLPAFKALMEHYRKEKNNG